MENRPDRWQEETISSEQIYEGKVISLQVDTVGLPEGRTATREIVRHPGAAAVIALHEGRLLVVEQYRKPLEKFQVEIPAGKLDPGENPLEAAARELEEETGYKPVKLVPVSAFYTSPGFADEKLHLYFTDGVLAGKEQPDADEFLAVSRLTLEEAKRYIAEKRISDAKTILAVYVWQHYLHTGDVG